MTTDWKVYTPDDLPKSRGSEDLNFYRIKATALALAAAQAKLHDLETAIVDKGDDRNALLWIEIRELRAKNDALRMRVAELESGRDESVTEWNKNFKAAAATEANMLLHSANKRLRDAIDWAASRFEGQNVYTDGWQERFATELRKRANL